MNDTLSMATNAMAIVVVAKAGAALVGDTSWRGRPFPRVAAALFVLVAVPSTVQLAWPAVLHALDRQPALFVHHGQVWRLVTAAFVQDGGIPGTVFNLVTLAVIASLAEWYWGGRRVLVVFLGAAVLFNAQGVIFDAAGAGSSGATYALGATLAGVLILTGAGQRRRLALCCPLLGALMLGFGNVHGLALLYGTAIGLVACAWSAREIGRTGARSGVGVAR